MNAIVSKIKLLLIMRCFLFFLTLQTFAFKTQAQEVSATVSLDSTLILIGGQIDMKLEISQPTNAILNIPQFTDTITKNIEVVDKGLLDTTVLENNRLVISQLYRITSFDTGLHYIPSYEIEFKLNNLDQIIKTNPQSLMVANPFQDVNPENGITDIKGVLNTPFLISEIAEYLYIILGILLVIGLAIWIYFYYKKKSNIGESKIIKVKPSEPPHIIAIRALDEIKEQKLWEKDRTKEFYTLVSNTIREYIENRYNITALEQTSDEILYDINSKLKLDKEFVDKLTQMLQLSDLVKFAKYTPLPDENGLSLLNAYAFVENTKEMKQPIPEVKEGGKSDNNENTEKQIS